MPDLNPVVLDPVSITAFVQHIIDIHATSSTLIYCGPKADFLDKLKTTIQQRQQQTHSTVEHATEPPPGQTNKNPPTHQLLEKPTLRLLATTRTLNLAFCPDITHLRGYLATYAHRSATSSKVPEQNPEEPGRIPVLALLNPIAQHKPTSSFSAQGLNRTFATAVEAAWEVRCKLVVAETTQPGRAETGDGEADGGGEGEGDSREGVREAAGSVWDEEVSILNVTTKSFGAGERGWVGRTVSLRRVVGRWCGFYTLPVAAE